MGAPTFRPHLVYTLCAVAVAVLACSSSSSGLVHSVGPGCPGADTFCTATTCCPTDHPSCCGNGLCGVDQAACAASSGSSSGGGADGGGSGSGSGSGGSGSGSGGSGSSGGSTVPSVPVSCESGWTTCADGSCCPSDHGVCCGDGECGATQSACNAGNGSSGGSSGGSGGGSGGSSSCGGSSGSGGAGSSWCCCDHPASELVGYFCSTSAQGGTACSCNVLTPGDDCNHFCQSESGSMVPSCDTTTPCCTSYMGTECDCIGSGSYACFGNNNSCADYQLGRPTASQCPLPGPVPGGSSGGPSSSSGSGGPCGSSSGSVSDSAACLANGAATTAANNCQDCCSGKCYFSQATTSTVICTNSCNQGGACTANYQCCFPLVCANGACGAGQ